MHLSGAACIAVLCGAVLFGARHDTPTPDTGIGNASALSAAYARWEAAERRAGRGHLLVLALANVKGLSQRYAAARGQVTLDLMTGAVRAELSRLDGEPPLELWLVDNRDGAGRSLRPEPGDRLIRVGRFDVADGKASLAAQLDPATVRGFEIDLAVVGAPGMHPGEGGLLFGMPSLFQKLRFAARGGAAEPGVAAGFGALVPQPAQAGDSQGVGNMEGLVSQGEDLFFNETFDGNGRTCGTCHPAENNFTLDPEFIAGLPPDDPLFVADPDSPAFIPALAEGFEKPQLMEEFGLILENVDGFDRPGVMRGVPHTLGLPTSMDASDDDIENGFPVQRTGWSADGAPLDGSLKAFAVGAVTQHFPLTLDRIEGLDFRLPTDHELDAMEAFQLTLGRQENLDLSTLALADEDASAGQALFAQADVRCNACHLNAGANAIFDPNVNRNFDTGVEALVDLIADPGLGRSVRPVDAGFGRDPRDPADGGGFGTGEFNTTTLVEAADTPPFFHNNTVATLEEAVAFYTSTEFANSPAGFGSPVALDATGIDQVAAFLRVINALENIRSALDAADRSRQLGNYDKALPLITFAASETEDAFQVLQGSPLGLHPDEVALLISAHDDLIFAANEATSRRDRKFFTEDAMEKLEAARAGMLDAAS